MRLLKLALEKQRWDLAAHAIVFASARMLNNGYRDTKQKVGDKPNGRQNREKKGCPQR